jgi:hypothetical protein
MKLCDDCKWAEWKRTASGRLHHDKTGRCKKEVKIPDLPQAFWCDALYSLQIKGGYIERGVENKDHCIYYERRTT